MMSRAPHIAPDMRFGRKMGDATFVDMLLGPLTDPFGHGHMGITAENVAAQFDISREQQDEFACRSHKRAVHAIDNGYFKDQIIAFDAKAGRKTISFDTDEHIRRDASFEQMSGLRPVFQRRHCNRWQCLWY